MTTTTKTILVVSGVAVGAFLLTKALAPKASSSSFSLFGAGTGSSVAQGIFSSLGSLVNQFTKPSSSSSSSSSSRSPSIPDGFDTSNYTVTNNSFYEDANGNFVVG